MELPEHTRAQLDGAEGKAMQLAARLVVRAAEIMEAERLLPISFAHLDACFYTGQAHVDFVRYLIDNGATLALLGSEQCSCITKPRSVARCR